MSRSIFRRLSGVLVRAAAPAVGVVLCSCSVTSPPPVTAAPEAGNVHYTDFVHKGKAYRAKMTVEKTDIVQEDRVGAHLKVRTYVLGWNPKTGAYDRWLTPTTTASAGADSGFCIFRSGPNKDKLFVSGNGGSGGSGDLGIPGWMGEVTIGLDPGSNTHTEAPLTMKVNVDYRIRPSIGVDEPVLAKISVPYSWRVAPKPESREGLTIAMARQTLE